MEEVRDEPYLWFLWTLNIMFTYLLWTLQTKYLAVYPSFVINMIHTVLKTWGTVAPLSWLGKFGENGISGHGLGQFGNNIYLYIVIIKLTNKYRKQKTKFICT